MGVPHKGCKTFSKIWISPGSSSVKKDSITKHLHGEQHKLAANLAKRGLLGAVAYKEAVSNESPIGRSLRTMSQHDKDQ